MWRGGKRLPARETGARPCDLARHLAPRGLRVRLDLTIGLFVVLVGIAMAAKSSAHPYRVQAALWLYGLTVVGALERAVRPELTPSASMR